jgi:Transposase DNA-binding/Transposase Tn5 dimerisation domain
MPEIPADESWAVTELADAAWGDARRTQRLITLATVLAQRPSASLPEACGSRAMLKAVYRFFDKDAIAPPAILASHVEATTARLATVPRVLAVQDTTELDWTAHPATTGLGPLAHPDHRGVHVHTTLTLTPERLPVGVLAQQVWARASDTVGNRATRKRRPITQKESQQWRTSVEAVSAARAQCPQTDFVGVGDRAADVYDLFLQERPSGVDLLVRASWNRCVDHPERYLWPKVEASPGGTTLAVQVPRRDGQPARQASVTVRWCLVLLCPPTHRRAEQLPTLAVWAVLAREDHSPAGLEPLEWLLLTTCAVQTPEDAIERVTWYACRWGIEGLHQVLKSGCRLEARQLETAARLRRCLAVYRVLAWRILYATLLRRARPDVPCTALLEPEEWQALYCAIHVTSTPPTTPPPLRQAVHWIGRLGGFLARRADGEPGVTVLWRGFQHLTDLTLMYRIMRPPPRKPHNVGKA